MIWVTYLPTGAIDCAGHGTPPSGVPCIEITAAEYGQLMRGIGAFCVANGRLAPYTQPLSVQLSSTKTAQRAIIKSSFIAASTANVTDSNGIVWEGGMQSGNSIFLGCQLAQQAGQSTITLYDANKAPHSMTIAEGMGVAALIGTAYQEALAKKNTLYANIDAADSVSEVQSVTW